MRLLLDTNLIVWAADETEKLSDAARARMSDPANELMFSVVSLWEIVIKLGVGRNIIRGDVRILRQALLDNGYREVEVSAAHTLAVGELPLLHRDPFDRLLVAQARIEGALLLTADSLVARYPGAILKV